MALLLAVWAGAMLLYVGTLGNPPIWDDHHFVFGQPFLMDCANLPATVSPKSLVEVLPARNAARPVWLASVVADTCVGGGQIHVYRLTSVFWHAVAAMLVLAAGWALSKDLAAGLLAAGLFAAHPVHAEAVNIITYRSDLLALVFMLASLLLYRGGIGKAGWRRHALWGAGLFCAGLALLSKEMAVTLPLLLLLGDVLFPPRRSGAASRRQRWGFLAACVLLVLAYLVFRTPRSGYVMGSHADIFSRWRQSTDWPLSRPSQAEEDETAIEGQPKMISSPPWQIVYDSPPIRFLTMSRVFGSYLRILFWPRPLQGDYAPAVLSSWKHPGLLASWAAWLLLFAAAWALRRRLPLASFGLLWTAITLFPVSCIVIIRNLQADRYLYVASAGFCLAAGAGLSAWGKALRPSRRKRLPLLAGAALAVFWAALTLARNRDFRSDLRFLEATAAADPSVPRVQLSLAEVYADLGLDDLAEDKYRDALRLWPRYRQAYLALARFQAGRERYAQAAATLERARNHFPQDALVTARLGRARWLSGDSRGGRRMMEEASRLAPSAWRPRLDLGILLLELGHPRQALTPLRAALAATRGEPSQVLYHLALACRRSGRASEAGKWEDALRQASPALAARLRGPRPRPIRPYFADE